MSKLTMSWCKICRDTDPDVFCAVESCNKGFHYECIQYAGLRPITDKKADYVCDECREGETEDTVCFRCKSSSHGKFMICCEECDKMVHSECMNMGLIKAGSHEWICEDCKTRSSNQLTKDAAQAVKSSQKRDSKLNNVNICYVCQKEGKLLGCNSCEQSYHPSCIDTDFLEASLEEEVWRCPLCLGIDPLKHMQHKRLSKTERLRRAQECQKCIEEQSKNCKYNRNKFLCENLETLRPFATPAAIFKIEKICSRYERQRAAGVKAHRTLYDNLSEREKDSDNLNENPASPSSQISSYQRESLIKKIIESCESSGSEFLKKGVLLKNYQKWGVNWLLESFFSRAGAILADEMGLGKTIQTLAFISALRALGISGPHLIVVQLSTVGNWIREVRKFVPMCSYVKMCGSRQEIEHSMSDSLALNGIFDIYITTYEAVVTHESFFTDYFGWQSMVLDEAHRIKNESARIRHSLDRVRCNMRILLTGTPLQNNVKELLTLFSFLFPDIFMSASSIEEGFRARDDSQERALRTRSDAPPTMDTSCVTPIKRLLAKLMLRRTKEAVIKLPSKIERSIWVLLTPEAAKVYALLLKISRNEEISSSARKFLGTVVKMRICCCHPRGLLNREATLRSLFNVVSTASPELMSQLKVLVDKMLNYNTGQEHVVMSSKLIFVDRLLTRLHAENIKYCKTYEKDYNLFLGSLEPASRPGRHLFTDTTSEVSQNAFQGLAQPDPEDASQDGSSTASKVEGRTSDASIPNFSFVEFMLPASLSDAEKKRLSRAVIGGADSVSELSEADFQLFRPHKVLIFTQFQLVLDELQEYCENRKWRYMRLDGSTNKLIRELDIREFSTYESSHLVYLICTRAGGLGINLVTANQVILFDEDWNPFVDLQAIDRAHRIGQLRNVHVWRIITKFTVEQRMYLRRQEKLNLDRLLIKGSRLSDVDCSPLLDERKNLFEVAEEMKNASNFAEKYPSAKFPDCSWTPDCSLESFACPQSSVLSDGTSMEPLSGVDEEASLEAKYYEQKEEKRDVEKESPDEMALSETTVDSGDKVAREGEISTTSGRPRRLRKAPPTLYNPTGKIIQRPSKPEVRLIRDSECFICGEGPDCSRFAKHDRKGVKQKGCPEAAAKSAPQQFCIRCPKSYHLHCLGSSETAKTWTCPWHECCLCQRKSSVAGGLLIHCAQCPTAFCFDCFPLDYRRYTPPTSFFKSLQQKGWRIVPENFITFMCSKCKALEERKRQASLSQAELELELSKKKASEGLILEEVKKLQEKKKLKTKQTKITRKAAKSKEMEEKKKFIEMKRKTDEADKKISNDLRGAIESLFPCEFISLLAARRDPSQVYHNYCEPTIANPLGLAVAHTQKPGDPLLSGKKKDQVSDKWKSPGSFIRFCENCQMPLHDSSCCPFPQEQTRVRIAAISKDIEVRKNERNLVDKPPTQTPGSELPSELHTSEHSMPESSRTNHIVSEVDSGHTRHSQSLFAEETPSNAVSMNQANHVAAMETAEIDREVGGVVQGNTGSELPFSKRIKFRMLCSKCGDSKTHHWRKHCPQITKAEKDEYLERTENCLKLIEMLLKLKETTQRTLEDLFKTTIASFNLDTSSEPIPDKCWETLRKKLNLEVNRLLAKSMSTVGLGSCVTTIRVEKANETSASEASMLENIEQKKVFTNLGGKSKTVSDVLSISPALESGLPHLLESKDSFYTPVMKKRDSTHFKVESQNFSSDLATELSTTKKMCNGISSCLSSILPTTLSPESKMNLEMTLRNISVADLAT